MSSAPARDWRAIQSVIDALPDPVFLVDDDLGILTFNRAAAPLVGDEPVARLHVRGGDAIHCLEAVNSPDGCGSGPRCGSCAIRTSVRESRRNGAIVRRKTRLARIEGGKRTDLFLLVTASPLEVDGRRETLLVLEDIRGWIDVQALLPICAGCKAVRSTPDDWERIEAYLEAHLDVGFTHGYCPDCLARLHASLSSR